MVQENELEWIRQLNTTWEPMMTIQNLVSYPNETEDKHQGEYLDPAKRKYQENGENCIMKSFITCTIH
jgi:hypothetical protein